jgi:Cu(I)/Ag(I) efflux system membrane protein CusA/SilA
MIQIGPETRRGIAELNGEGEVAGGVVVMRSGRNALTTIGAVKAKLEQLKPSLPCGRGSRHDLRSSQLYRACSPQPARSLVEEFIVVALVCALFLLHLRSAFVAVVACRRHPDRVHRHALPGCQRNIMSLGGIAIAVGAMVDAAVVMIENAHKHLESVSPPASRRELTETTRVVASSATLRSRSASALFSRCSSSRSRSFRCSASKRRRAACFRHSLSPRPTRWPRRPGVSVTLVPVLMGYLIRGRIPDESRNPLNRAVDCRDTGRLLRWVLRFPKTTMRAALV